MKNSIDKRKLMDRDGAVKKDKPKYAGVKN